MYYIFNKKTGKIIADYFRTKRDAKQWIVENMFLESINLRIKRHNFSIRHGADHGRT